MSEDLEPSLDDWPSKDDCTEEHTLEEKIVECAEQDVRQFLITTTLNRRDNKSRFFGRFSVILPDTHGMVWVQSRMSTDQGLINELESYGMTPDIKRFNLKGTRRVQICSDIIQQTAELYWRHYSARNLSVNYSSQIQRAHLSDVWKTLIDIKDITDSYIDNMQEEKFKKAKNELDNIGALCSSPKLRPYYTEMLPAALESDELTIAQDLCKKFLGMYQLYHSGRPSENGDLLVPWLNQLKKDTSLNV